MTQLAALIFDVDGTLAETERDAHRIAFNDTFTAYGLDWYWSETLYGQLLAISGGKERIRFYLEHHRPQEFRRNNVEKLVTAIHHDKTQRYLSLLREGNVPLRIGVQRLLEEARDAQLRLAIATTTNDDNVVTLLQQSLHFDAVHWFEVIAAGDIVSAKKPASDIYHYALQQLRLSADQCLAIEDSNNGLRAALGAGIRTLITVSDYTQQDDFSGATLVLNHLGEPHQPFTVLAGNAGEARWVDVALLKVLSDSQ
jgi:HAD superfamily hydrolase (TIGR01509 family)